VRWRTIALAVLEPSLGLAVATPGAAAQAQAPDTTTPHVRILNPERGAFLTGRSVAVVLEIQGIALAPATERRPGTAHCDLFLDRDLTAATIAVPFWTVGVTHLSHGQLWHTFEGLQPGPHRLIALLVDPYHVPLKPLVADTARFTLKPRP
jgi:hypothetical protein